MRLEGSFQERYSVAQMAYYALVFGKMELQIRPARSLVSVTRARSSSYELVVCKIKGLRVSFQAFGIRINGAVEESSSLGGVSGSPFPSRLFVLISGFKEVVLRLRLGRFELSFWLGLEHILLPWRHSCSQGKVER